MFDGYVFRLILLVSSAVEVFLSTSFVIGVEAFLSTSFVIGVEAFLSTRLEAVESLAEGVPCLLDRVSKAFLFSVIHTDKRKHV